MKKRQASIDSTLGYRRVYIGYNIFTLVTAFCVKLIWLCRLLYRIIHCKRSWARKNVTIEYPREGIFSEMDTVFSLEEPRLLGPYN